MPLKRRMSASDGIQAWPERGIEDPASRMISR
jgi:hypothetical protein